MSVEALRLELRTRNNRLWHLVFDEYPSVAAFARAHGVSHFRVGAFLNLTETPYKRRGEPCVLALTLSILAGCTVEELFPRVLYQRDCPRRLVAEVPARALRSLASAETLALPPAQEDALEHRELRAMLSSCLDRLTPREAQVLRRRYGLDGYEEETLADVAAAFERSPERIRQIEIRAIGKLRRQRWRQLEPFMADFDESRPSERKDD
jgi:RNA polymerase sigma factor (sigma-70 family)